jgi:phosphatidylglycerol:prolipoprotein diacylglycerol transferase
MVLEDPSLVECLKAFKISCLLGDDRLYWTAMLPRLLSFEWGSLAFHLNGYGFSIFCGTMAALAISLRRARERSLPLRPLLGVFSVALGGLFVGAKLAYVLQFGSWAFPGGWVFYGGLIGGTAAALGACRRRGLPALEVADLGVPCALLAAAFGRVGCFFAGCCFGTVWDGGVSYPAGSPAWRHQLKAGLIAPDALRSLPIVPAPLLEAGAMLAVFVAASWLWRRRVRPGRTLALCGALYSGWRFAAELWRGDHGPYWGSLLTFSQGTSLAVLAASLVLFHRRPDRSAASVRAAVREPIAAHIGAILLVVATLTGSVGCSAKDRHDAADEVAESCISSCIDSCSDACCEGCSGEKAPGTRTAAGTDSGAIWLRFPPVEAARRYAGRLTATATLNETELQLEVAGTFTASTPDENGTRLVNVQLSALELRAGKLSLSAAAGDAEIRVSSKGRAVFRATTLSGDAAGVLKAFEPFSRGFLEVDTKVAPALEWAQRIQRELNAPDARGECRGELVLDEKSYPFAAAGLVTQDSNGERRIQWLPRR